MLDRIYLPEPWTLALTMVLVILLTSLNYVVIWLQNRQQVALVWMLAASLLSTLGFVLRIALPGPAGVVIAPVSILVAVGCIWMGCRAVGGRGPWLPALLIPPALWLLLCCLPGFFTPPTARFAAPCLLVAPLLVLALGALWPTGAERRIGRWFVSALLSIQTAICLGWGIAQGVSMARDLGIGTDAVDLPFSAFTLMGFNLMMSFAFVALVKEQSDWDYMQTAQRDALTGLGNRRRLDDSLQKAWRVSRRTGTPLAVLMIDVDHFKAYNDRYGHPAGDACLRAIAHALRGGLLRRTDEVSRYGGEEFAVLLADTADPEARAVAERLRLAVREMALPHPAGPDGIVTISLGVAVAGAASGLSDGAALLQAADQALYRAKEAGRDRIEIFASASARPPAPPSPALRLGPV